MSALDVKSYTNIDRIKYNKLKSKAEHENIDVPGGDNGIIREKKYGIAVLVDYGEQARTLTLRIVTRNSQIPNQKIWDFLDPIIAEVQRQN